MLSQFAFIDGNQFPVSSDFELPVAVRMMVTLSIFRFPLPHTTSVIFNSRLITVSILCAKIVEHNIPSVNHNLDY